MLKQLQSAREQLRASLDNYITVFSLVNDCLKHVQTLPSHPPELASCLENEFALISSYEQKLQKARISIGCARNHLTSVTPISKLPVEILTRIFCLVSADYCHLPPLDSPPYFPKYTRYPDFLAQVCSHWRKIALSTPSLWAHIDLTPHPVLGRGTFDRAQAYTKRADGILCEIHLDDKECAGDFSYDVDRIISNLASRSKALEFAITSPKLLGFHGSVFQRLIVGCEPKTFKRLCVHSDASLPDPFIKGRDYGPWGGGHYYANRDMDLAPNVLRLSENEMNYRLAGVTTLHLQGVFFSWSSELYHGLDDLRLTSPINGNASEIFQSSLLSILSNSPGLKVLYFSLDLITPEDADDEPMHDPPIGPVSLRDLEVVHLSTTRARNDNRSNLHVGSLLRLLAPGSKPLRLTLEVTSHINEGLLDSDNTREFFTRCKVEKLCIRNGAPVMGYLPLCRLPDLKVLVFDSCLMQDHAASYSALGLHTWVIHNTTVHGSDLPRLVELCPNGLVLSQVEVLSNDTPIQLVPNEELQASFPTIRFEEVWRHDPTGDWDIVD